MADLIGQNLGNYRLVRLLGRGGFAEVYLGEHIRLGTYVAIKVLSTRLGNKDDIEGFQKEARNIAHLEHAHIVRVFDFDVVNDIPFLVMNYAPNGTLRQRHPKGTLLPLSTITSYTRQVADALQYAHDQHLIHRDIKPENMLVGPRNEVLLSDFGIAIVAQSSRYQGTQDMAGTIGYMAPEQIQAHPRPASDQYALGIVIYEWLSGERPFHGSFTEIAIKHSIVPPPPLREKLPQLSPDVEQVIMTALAKDPKQRFGSVKAFATALEQASIAAGDRALIPPLLEPTIPAQPPLPFMQRALPVIPSPQQPIAPPPGTEGYTAPALSFGYAPPTPRPELMQPPKKSRVGVISLLVLIVLASIAGLGFILSNHPTPPQTTITPTVTQTPGISGTWVGTDSGGYINNFLLTQTGESISGTGNSHNGTYHDTETITGSISGKLVSLTVHIINNNCDQKFTLTLSQNGQSMTGGFIGCNQSNYTIQLDKQ